MDTKKTILITGAAGYVGAMLVNEFAKRDDVGKIIGIDKEAAPELIRDNPKLTYIEQNLADNGWEKKARALAPDIVIHTAWHIREIYGNHALTWKWNIEASDRVFDFAFTEPSVTRLIHFSTVASYGAFASNEIDFRYTEEDSFRKTDYLYAEEKRIAEEHLRKRFARRTNQEVAVAVVRPAAITGPRGRFDRIRFGLQSALSGSLSGEKSFAYRVVSLLVSRIPATPKWLRQFIHEDDVVGITERLVFGELPGTYEVFNICPPGPAVRAGDMARAVGKKVLPIAPWMMRVGNFFAWHLSHGKIPTGKGSWKSYSYPIAVDGSKVTKVLGYQYRFSSLDAFEFTDGRYESCVPEEARKHK
ncbi:MAG: NAD-dependent epimerase/dehydratase family protein [Candidatus Pacebacteria bacterium]|nr:NAD-dependent epimerase/dehydratase family protein [Candidatus Paceibacterota bacterium]MBP9840750.1 NAD-dependent epimerase/dehydratase family protein [Candidatus Paceibacterota bacterium]